jgi:transcriptional regulator with XRE-family HTH domain
MDNEFVVWLSVELKRRGWSDSELARRMDTSPATVSRVMSGQILPSWDFCVGVAKAFNMRPETLFRMAGLLPSLPPAVAEEEEVIATFRQLNTHDRQAALKVLRGLAEYPSPEPLEMIMMREIPQLDALRQAIALWGQGKEIEAFWPLAAVLSPEMQEKVEQFLLELKEVESQEIPRPEGGN